MIQIIDSIMNTCMKYADTYLPWAAVIIVALTLGGVVLRVLKRS